MDCDEELPAETNSKPKINIDITAIESIQTEDQDLELQSLGLSVYDQNIFEKGVLEQYSKALTGDSEQLFKDEDSHTLDTEDGEINAVEDNTNASAEENSAASPNQDVSKNRLAESVNQIEEYLKTQLKFQEIKNSRNDSKKKANTVSSIFKKKKQNIVHFKQEDVKSEKSEVNKKGKYVGVGKKKKKKEKLGTKKGQCRRDSSPSLQPGEGSYFYNNTSGSEYVPTDDDDDDDDDSISSAEFQLKRLIKPKKSLAKKKKSKGSFSYSDRADTDDSDWDEETIRKSRKELDDGEMELYCKRMKQFDRTREKIGVHVVQGDFVIPKDIWDKLYDYQKESVKWFWKLNRELCGGILGDEMGLGKTVQVIAFLAALHRSHISDLFTRHEGLGPSLIVCPTTVMHQWVREFHAWYPALRVAILHESGTYQGKDRSKLIDSIHRSSSEGILITSYNGLVQYQESILPKEWHYVILDEGHKIRNIKAKVTETAMKLDTPHRIILSGSPLQNNLQELWCLFNFVCPGKLGTVQVFMDTFAAPIMRGGYANASKAQVVTAHKCATILKDTISPFLLRRMKEDVGSLIHLPDKKEQVLFCRLTDDQRELYKEYLNNVDLEDMVRGRAKLFVALINLRKICNHPDLYSGGPNRNFVMSTEEGAPDERHFGYWERAGKMIVIQTLLKIWNQQGHRVLLFTQSKRMLLVLEDYVKRSNYKYLKLDGQTSVSARQPLIDKFNKDTSFFVMLLTTKVGGLGVNLTGANRVVIYDPDWNPATDTQARERAWRIGQQKDVTIYRLITAGTIEEKIYHRQIFKQFLSNKILKDPKQRRFFKSNDLLELFTLSETIRNGTVETAAIFAGTGSEIRKSDVKSKPAPPSPGVSFSQSKIDEMKKFAQMLSKKISEKNNNELMNGGEAEKKEPISIYRADGTIDVESAQKVIQTSASSSTHPPSEQSPQPSSSSASDPLPSLQDTPHPEKEKKKHKSKKYKESFAKYEGQEVPHLVKKRKYKKQSESEDKEKYMSQDDYVLKKLFSKGIESAMKHDTIMEGGPSDYAIVEAEAERVAQEALKELKKSEAVATRFTPIVKRRKLKDGEEDLGAIMRRRNMEMGPERTDKALLSDMISWLQSQGGTATTEKLLDEFRSKVGEGKSPVFKALLEKVASFYRGPDKVGYWTIRDEFNASSSSSSR